MLKRLGYEVLGFHVDLGIDLNDYSPKSREAVLTFSRRFEIPVEIVSLKEAYDKTIPDVYKREKKICPICGMTRRHLMNAYALKAAEVYGAYALATGHHLDDLTAQLFANVLRWDFHYLAKGLPVLPPEDGFARKIKPLALTSEFEVVAFARLHNVEFVRCSCPLGKDAKFRKYQSMLRAIEALSPGTKRYFYQRYTEIAHIFAEQAPEARPALRKCLVCGMPSSSPVCSFCRIWRPEEAEAALRQYRGFTLSPLRENGARAQANRSPASPREGLPAFRKTYLDRCGSRSAVPLLARIVPLDDKTDRTPKRPVRFRLASRFGSGRAFTPRFAFPIRSGDETGDEGVGEGGRQGFPQMRRRIHQGTNTWARGRSRAATSLSATMAGSRKSQRRLEKKGRKTLSPLWAANSVAAGAG